MNIDFEKHIRATSLSRAVSFDDNRTLLDYACRCQVRTASDGTLQIDKLVTNLIENDTKFSLLLDANELDLAEGCYVIALKISNAISGEAVEHRFGIEIVENWVK